MDSHLLPGVKPKLFGKYRGIVAVGKDPTGKGRIKVKIPALFGFKIMDAWAYPVLPPQFVGVDVGETGKLQFDWHDASLNAPSMDSPSLNGVAQAGAQVVPGTISASTATASSLTAEPGNAGTFVRKKLPSIIPVEPASWEIPVGTGVWVEFEAGDPDKPIWVGFWK
ncbi:MAG: hypothetical protein ACM3ZC_13520 [Bacteroidota bacterium]